MMNQRTRSAAGRPPSSSMLRLSKHPRRLDGIAVAASLAIISLTYSAAAEPLRVAVGGTSGLASLANGKATTDFRSRTGTGFYLHYSATDPKRFGNILPEISTVFKGRSSIAEVSLGGGFNPQFWTTGWRTNVLAYGFSPDRVVVNVDLEPSRASAAVFDQTVKKFEAFIDAGREKTGVKIFAPVISPNQSGGIGPQGDATTMAVAHPWASSWWDGARAIALSGGGLTLDAPPAFFFHGLPDKVQQDAYQRFEIDLLRWAKQKGLWSTAIVSPYFDGASFMADSQAFYKALENAGALPDTFSVENYNECGDPFPKPCDKGDAAFLAPVGEENERNTVAAVALWLSAHSHR